MNVPCALCGAPRAQGHHITGRLVADAPYFDPAAMVPLCARCHAAEHQLWRLVGIDRLPASLPARLWRTSLLLARFGDRNRPLPPTACTGIAVVLSDVAGQLPGAELVEALR